MSRGKSKVGLQVDVFTPFTALPHHLWALWEMVLLAEPLLVVAPSPGPPPSLLNSIIHQALPSYPLSFTTAVGSFHVNCMLSQRTFFSLPLYLLLVCQHTCHRETHIAPANLSYSEQLQCQVHLWYKAHQACVWSRGVSLTSTMHQLG